MKVAEINFPQFDFQELPQIKEFRSNGSEVSDYSNKMDDIRKFSKSMNFNHQKKKNEERSSYIISDAMTLKDSIWNKRYSEKMQIFQTQKDSRNKVFLDETENFQRKLNATLDQNGFENKEEKFKKTRIKRKKILLDSKVIDKFGTFLNENEENNNSIPPKERSLNLDLNEKGICGIDKEDFIKNKITFSRVSKLNFKSNPDVTLNYQFLICFPNLKILNFSLNKIKILRIFETKFENEKFLKELPKLEKLNLSFNELKRNFILKENDESGEGKVIKIDMFDSLSLFKDSLKSINLGFNRISEIPYDLSMFSQLSSFNLESNLLSETCFIGLNSIPNLEILNLENNKIFRISGEVSIMEEKSKEKKILKNKLKFKNLTTIVLNKNKIRFSEDLFYLNHFKKIQKCFLIENPISENMTEVRKCQKNMREKVELTFFDDTSNSSQKNFIYSDFFSSNNQLIQKITDVRDITQEINKKAKFLEEKKKKLEEEAFNKNFDNFKNEDKKNENENEETKMFFITETDNKEEKETNIIDQDLDNKEIKEKLSKMTFVKKRKKKIFETTKTKFLERFERVDYNLEWKKMSQILDEIKDIDENDEYYIKRNHVSLQYMSKKALYVYLKHTIGQIHI